LAQPIREPAGIVILEEQCRPIPNLEVLVSHFSSLSLFEQRFAQHGIDWSALWLLLHSANTANTVRRRLDFTSRQKSMEMVPADAVTWSVAIPNVHGLQLATVYPAEDLVRRDSQ
jgi:hypothetical protein